MVKVSTALAVLLLAYGASAIHPAFAKRGSELYQEVARNPELQKIVLADIAAEKETKWKKPSKKIELERDLVDKAFEVEAKHIEKFHSITIIGDSYTSGDGAVKNAGNGTCRRNQGSFGYRLNKIFSPDSFAFLACSGATVNDIQNKQVNGKKYGSPDLVVFTAGGDNGGSFVGVLLGCILNPSVKKCDKALAKADKMADELPASLEPLYKSITSKATEDRKREVIHLGYIQMYNRDAPLDQCPAQGHRFGSNVTWPSAGPGGYREKINNIIIKINAKIKEAAEKHGVTYVDADSHFDGHRFCDRPSTSWMQHKLSLVAEGGIICHPTFEGHSAYITAILHYLKSQKA